MSHGSGIDITASQTSNELLDLCYNRADGCEVGGGKRPCDRDGERDFAVGEGPVLVKHGL